MTIDVLTVSVGLTSFAIFFLIHVITFRWVRPEHLLKSLLVCVLVLMLVPVLLTGILCILKVVDLSLQAWVCAAILALIIQGLLCFVYILCVFGPYETSVRMRLVREMAAHFRGISLQELLQRYNTEMIVKVRLRRLIGSGDVIEKNGIYRMGHVQNFFFIFDAIAGVIKKWIGR